MLKYKQIIVYILIILTGIVACYSIFNAGNPQSLLRLIIKEPKNDVYMAFVSSVSVFILCFFIFFAKDKEQFQNIVELNKKKIKKLKKEGKTEAEIADSILTAMGMISGYRYNLAKKKLIFYMSHI